MVLLVLMLMPMLMLEPLAVVTALFSEDLAATEMSSEVTEVVKVVKAAVDTDKAALLVLMLMLTLMPMLEVMFLVDTEMPLKEQALDMEDLVAKVDTADQPEEAQTPTLRHLLTRSRPAVAPKPSPTLRPTRTPTADRRRRTAPANRQPSQMDRDPRMPMHTRPATHLPGLTVK